MRHAIAVMLAVALLSAGCTTAGSTDVERPAAFLGANVAPSAVSGLQKIKHVIIIMQENRSFDSYFGTYPGADGFPRQNGKIAVCVPDPRIKHCVRPFHDTRSLQGHGGLHNTSADAWLDINRGKMNGFLMRPYMQNCGNCTLTRPFAMGYRTRREIPNYWTLAHRYVLADHLFAPNIGWSLPAHLYSVSGWSAKCATTAPSSCVRQVSGRNGGPYSWTPLTYLLHKHHVSWSYYVDRGLSPDCPVQDRCKLTHLSPRTASIWNPLPAFTTTTSTHQRKNIKAATQFFVQARAGTLPAVSWVIPNERHSEHPPATIANGQHWVTRIINSVMASSAWRSSAIFLTWDEWGGYYDHVVPPRVDSQGYGIRVPGLLISPYARKGYIDHQTLSFDAYLKFIEDVFLRGARLNPLTDGRPDPRPYVRENWPGLGDLAREFNFNQAPRAPKLLPQWTKHG
jgi:phospholipase C